MAGEIQTYVFQTPTELREVENLKLPRLVNNSIIFRWFPLEYRRAFHLEWSQKDMYGGMTQIRSLNGRPPRVAPVGERSFLMKPGVYGEYMLVDEYEMTMRAVNRLADGPIPLNDLVGQRQDQLLVRRLNRMEWLCWQLALYGQFIVQDVRGVIAHRDAYPVQNYVAPVVWSDRTNARPLDDLNQINLFGRGTGTDFGRRATLVINRITANHLSNNINPADLGGKKVGGGNTITTLPEVNTIFLGNDLPEVVVYDETYLDENNNQVPYIPNGKGVVFGALNNGETIGNFRFVFNANNEGGEPGPYMKVIDKSEWTVPAEVEVHDGWNGGPVIYYPGSIVTVDL
jgi:hypothetical protein